MDLQIDDFYKDCALGLLALYQAFPRRIALYVEDLIGHEPLDDFGLPGKRQQSCLSALLWLSEEGYLRYETTIGHAALDQAVLSEKGFLRLVRMVGDARHAELPASIRRQRDSLAQHLREALQQQDSERVARLCHGLLASPGDTV